MRPFISMTNLEPESRRRGTGLLKYWTVPFAVIYTILYGVAAFLAVNFGHGTGIFISPMIAFWGAGWLLLLLCIFVSNRPGLSTAWFLLPLLLHYFISATSVIYSWNGNLKPTMYFWNEDRGIIWLNLGIYVGGQIILWLTFLLTRRSARRSTLP